MGGALCDADPDNRDLRVIFEELAVAGVWRVALQAHADDRGFFARSFCGNEFAAHGLPCCFEQSSLSHNRRKGTLRGMHYRPDAHAETKFVRCVRGAIFDVVIDLRHDSTTRGQWLGLELSAENGVGLVVPKGLAHGFVTLQDDSDLLYMITPTYVPGPDVGVRWNDPRFAISWPIEDPILSPRDAAYPDWMP